MHGGSAKFSDLYELQEDIGVGSYSICKRCVHRVSAMDYAVKVTGHGNNPGMINKIGLLVKITFSDILGISALFEPDSPSHFHQRDAQ